MVKMTDPSHFTFGNTLSNDSSSTTTPTRNSEFTFTSDSSSSTGYLDEPSDSSSSSSSFKVGVNSTTLFSHLAQRQLSQAQYDDSTQWSHSPSQPQSPSIRRGVGEDGEESDYESEDSYDSAQLQKEWEEQVEQLKLMFQIIIFPFVGKFMGRKFGYYRK